MGRTTTVVLLILTAYFSVLCCQHTMGKPWASVVAKVQAPVQSCLRPAVWLPGLRMLHSHSESWTLPSDNNRDNLESVLSGIMKAIQEDTSGHYWDVQSVARAHIRVYVYTRAEWLDIIEIELKGHNAEVWSFSSGFLPLCIPFACVMNLPLFWIPFLDMGFNKKRVDQITAAMPIQVERH